MMFIIMMFVRSCHLYQHVSVLAASESPLPMVSPLDEQAMAAARQLQDRLTKPRGALGRLEELSVQLAGIAGACPPPVPTPAALCVFASDHGVVAQGVTPWPQEVTAQMAANIAGGGAAISVLARQHGATLIVVDVGIAGDVSDLPGIEHRKVRAGTADLSTGAAMSAAERDACIGIGRDVARRAIDSGARMIVTGEMGIGNTTASAALIAALTGVSVERCTGRGTGIDDAMLSHKIDIITGAVGRLDHASTPLDILAEVGGLEIAALAGLCIEAAAKRVPVLVDGVISLAALLVADRMVPGVARYVIAGHRSSEPGATVVLESLGLQPLVELDMRLGEGSGAATALPIVVSAALLIGQMATFDGAGVTDKAP
ncbi:MAG: nicotinate-nucleotide--dimethylbenzimidazole phosphoribosyltransferase [Acidimicrobiia bacterium]